MPEIEYYKIVIRQYGCVKLNTIAKCVKDEHGVELSKESHVKLDIKVSSLVNAGVMTKGYYDCEFYDDDDNLVESEILVA